MSVVFLNALFKRRMVFLDTESFGSFDAMVRFGFVYVLGPQALSCHSLLGHALPYSALHCPSLLYSPMSCGALLALRYHPWHTLEYLISF